MLFPSLNKINVSVLVLICFLLLIMPSILFAETTTAVPDKVDSNFIESILWGLVNGVFGFFVWVGGMLLNTAVTEYVVGFGDKFLNSGLGFAVDNLWTTVRDIFNLTFIFGLVYIGFKMILDSSDSNARKMLVHIILAALLVNFSLFFTKFIVDFSNIAATQIASSFNTGGAGNYLVADKFMDELGLSEIWGDGSTLGNMTQGQGGLTYIFGTMIVFIVTAFVFFAGGLLLMIRFVVLNIYMILSPIMFLGWVFPGMASYSQMWWSGFLGRAFFAPAYLLMLYFAATILTEFSALGNTEGLNAILTNPNAAQDGFVNSVQYFVMMCVFLIASIVVGQKMGADGANMAISIGKNMAGKARQGVQRGVQRGAGSVTFGAAGWVGQKTIGLGASKISESQSMKKFASKYGKVGEYAMNKTRAVADSSMDFRRTGIGKSLNMGEGVAGGYTSRVNEKIKADQVFAEKFGEVQIKDATGQYLAGMDKRIKDGITDSQEYKDISTLEQTAKNNLDIATKLVNDKRTELQTAKDKMTKDIVSLEKQLELAKNNPQETARINNELKETKEAEKQLGNDFSKIELAEREAKSNLKKVENDKVNIEKTLRAKQEAAIMFEHQLAYITQKEKDSKFFKSSKSLIAGAFGGTATGGAATLAGASVGAVPLVMLAGVGASTMYSVSDESVKSAKNLRRIYGLDGTNKIKLNQKKADLKILSEVTNDVNNQSADTANQSIPSASTTAPKST